MTYSKLIFTTGLFVSAAGVAQAELTICNDSDKTQAISIGYEGGEGWTSEGWWNIDPKDCAVVIGGDLDKQYYYFRAEQNAGPFVGGGYNFCTTPEVYEIVGDTDCESRGYDSEDFAEIDVGVGVASYTHRLTQADMDLAQAGSGSDGEDGLQFCNETAHTQSISIGYEGGDGFVSEG